ncbi:MAG TPA: hypothetical protein VKK79_07625, partial [Candidatus Lokiarchaeia archaeon]|nr:hypothetical protein [Candidatus Lokiarchaeia archaeon]
VLNLPKGSSAHAYLALLNSTAACVEILANARSQGTGLAKIQLFEYRQICIPDLVQCTQDVKDQFQEMGAKLTQTPAEKDAIVAEIDDLMWRTFQNDLLEPTKIQALYEKVNLQVKK